MTLTISTSSIITQILATSAMSRSLNPDAPAPLTTDSAPAIRRMCRGAFSLVVMAIAPVVQKCDILDNGLEASPEADLTDFNLSVTLIPEAAPSPIPLQLLIEQAIISRIMCEAYTPVHQPTAARHATAYLSLVDRLRSALTLSQAANTSIRPAWF